MCSIGPWFLFLQIWLCLGIWVFALICVHTSIVGVLASFLHVTTGERFDFYDGSELGCLLTFDIFFKNCFFFSYKRLAMTGL